MSIKHCIYLSSIESEYIGATSKFVHLIMSIINIYKSRDIKFRRSMDTHSDTTDFG
jgi:hypothetical protein